MTPERIVILVLAAVLGSVIGSFENVLAIRWHKDQSLMGRSACPSCGKKIRPQHLVPVISWLLLRGRCADCGKKIHSQYPLVEASAAVLAVLAALRHDPVTQFVPFLFEFIVTVGLIVPVVMDIRWKELPIEYLAGLGFVALAFRVFIGFLGGQDLLRLALDAVIASAGAAAFFGLQFFISRGKWLGEGDVWFGGMMGLILGTGMLTALGVYVTYILGGIVALVGLLTHAYKRGSRIPFAPLLAAGTLIAYWHGERLLQTLFSFTA